MRVPLELRPVGSSVFQSLCGDLDMVVDQPSITAVLSCVFGSEDIEYTKTSSWATDDDRSLFHGVRSSYSYGIDELRRQRILR